MAAKKRKNKDNLSEATDVSTAEQTAVCVTGESVNSTQISEVEAVEAVETDGVTATVSTEATDDIQEQEQAKPVRVPQKEKLLTPKQKRKRTALRWILLNVGILMMSCSVYFFQTPNNFTLGGVAGIAILLASVIPIEFFTQAVIMAIINVFLIILGLIILGKQCTVLTIYCSLLYTAVIWLLELVLPMSMITANLDTNGTLTNQPFLEMCYAILLFGVGGALVFNCGASSGGTDIIALILKKFTKINVGMALMIIDLIVVCVSITAFKDPTTALYSFMGLFAKSFLLDSVIENIGKTKYITIITKAPDVIGAYILEVINHGYTKYDAEGGYTGEKKKVLVTVCKRSEALRLKTKVKEFDPEAFVIITDANEILGKGFGASF